MTRRISFVAGWLATAAVALLISWLGVSIVADQVTTKRPATLSAAELEETIATASTTTTTDPSPTTIAADDDAAPPTPASPTTAAGATDTTVTSTVVATTPRTGPSSPQSAPTTTTATTVAAAPAPAPASTRTYNLVGGSVALRFSSGGVTVEYATPKAGFQVEIEPEHGNGMKVEFRSESHRSRVDGWWENGPVDRIREEPDD